MRMGPSLIGAIVGAVVGIGAQIGLERGFGHEATWIAIVIGVLTGLGARMMAGEFAKQASYLRGALAALIALAAIVGGSHVASALMKSKSISDFENKKVPTLPAADETEGEAASAAGEDNTGEETNADEGDTETPDDADDTDADDTDAGSDEDTSSEGDASADDTDAEETPEGDMEETTKGEATEDEAADATEDPATTVSTATLDENSIKKRQELPFDTKSLIFFGVGTFLAYELARGGGGKATS